MTELEKILIKHCYELEDVFLITKKQKDFKKKILKAMDEASKLNEK